MKSFIRLLLLGIALHTVLCDLYDTNEWISVGGDFPETNNILGKLPDFFYIRKGHNVTLKMQQKFYQMNEVDIFRINFDVWQSNLTIIKDFIVSPDHKTRIDYNKWYELPETREVSFKDAPDWYIRLFAEENSNMVSALRNLKLEYQGYVPLNDDSKEIIDDTPGIHKDLELKERKIKSKDPDMDALFFDCHASSCTVKLAPSPTERTVTFELFHESEAKITKPFELKSEGKFMNQDDVKIEAGKAYEIEIIATTDEPVRLVCYGAEFTQQSSSFVKTEEIRKFVDGTKKEYRIVANDQDVEEYENFTIGREYKMKNDDCFKLNYRFHDLTIDSMIVYVQTHSNSFSNIYKLFHIPGENIVQKSTEYIDFCLKDFIFDVEHLLDRRSSQLFISLKIKENKRNNKKSNVAMFKIEEFTKKPIRENPVIFLSNSITWARIYPEATGIKTSSVDGIVEISGSSVEQYVELHSAWVKYSDLLNPTKIHATLEVNGLQHSGTTIQSFFKDFVRIETLVCDEISVCVTTRIKDKRLDNNKLILEFDFDRHPRTRSHVLKILIKLKLKRFDPATKVNLILNSFGDPCFKDGDEKCQDKMGKKSSCRSNLLKELTQPFYDACYCDSENLCDSHFKPLCRRPNSVECICKQDNKHQNFFTWDSAVSDCLDSTQNILKLTSNTESTDFKWEYEFEEHDLENYDVCFKLHSSENDNDGIAKLEAILEDDKNNKINLFNITDLHLFSKEDLAEFCLSNFVVKKPEFRKFKIELKSKDPKKKFKFNKEDLMIYGENINNHKILTKMDDFKAVTTLPSNIAQIRNEKNFRFSSKNMEPFEVRFYSEWIENFKNLKREELDRNILKTENKNEWKEHFEICRPRTVPDPNNPIDDCIALTNNIKISSALNALKSDLIQIVFVLSSDKKIEGISTSNEDIGTIDMWNTCNVKNIVCLNGGSCISQNEFGKFKCDCQAGFSGDYCQIIDKDSCNETTQAICKLRESECIPLENQQFKCECPYGYRWNSILNKCQYLDIQTIKLDCKPFQPDECWLESNLYSEFHSLPKYFPLITTNSIEKNNVFFTFDSGKKISIPFENTVDKQDNDYCLDFKYFLSPSTKFSLIFNGTKLTTFEGRNTLDDRNNYKLSELTTICLRSFMKFDTFSSIGKWNIEFNSEIDSPKENSIVLQFYPHQINSNLIETKPFKEGDQATKFLNFLSPTTVDLAINQVKITNSEKLEYQWPIIIPYNNNIKGNKNNFEYEPHKDDTISKITLESTWIKRSIKLSKTIGGHVGLYFDFTRSTEFSLQVNLLDEKRQVIRTNNQFDLSKPTQKWILNNEDKIDIIYKIQIIIQAKNNDKKLKYFTISDISFGDPCELIKKSNKSCKRLDKNDQIVDDNSGTCKKILLDNGDVNFECKCDPTLSGNLCSKRNYCEKHHLFPFDETNGNIKYINKTGHKYCEEFQAKCINFIGTNGKPVQSNYNFECVCEDKTKYFNKKNRVCEDLSECTKNKCDEQTEICSDDGLECLCKNGYEKIDDKCVQLNQECDSKLLCDDPLMKCIRDPRYLNEKNQNFMCFCPIGFIQEMNNGKISCKSNMCENPSVNNCPHDCENIQSEPFYRCKCDNRFYSLKTYKDADNSITYKCEPVINIPPACKQCENDEYSICRPGSNPCACKKNYIKNSDGKCVLDQTIQWKTCPNGRIKIDDKTKKIICDCNNSTKQFFQEQNGVCHMKNNICQDGQAGRLFCNERNSGCLPSHENVEEFYCVCPKGKMFSSELDLLSVEKLKLHPTWTCVDPCEFPHNKHADAAKGFQCNILKECAPGTFLKYDKCTQPLNSLTFNISMKWTQNYRIKLDQIALEEFETISGKLSRVRLITKNDRINLLRIDPLSYNLAMLDAHHDNIKMYESYYRDVVSKSYTKEKLENSIRALFIGYNVIQEKNDLRLVRFDISPDTETVNMQLAIRYSIDKDEILDLNIFQVETNEALNDEAINELKKELQTNITQECGRLNTDTSECILPFLNGGSIFKIHSEDVKIDNPCKNGLNCLGMSDCVSRNGSQFECLCNSNYFDVEQTFAFESYNSDLRLKNEYCLPKNLCKDSCSLNKNQICKQYSPDFDKASLSWSVNTTCECIDHYVMSDEICAETCVVADCTKNGECIQDGLHNAKCKCKEGFYGDRCEHELSSNTVWIVVVSVLGVLTIVGIGAAIFFYSSTSRINNNSSSTTKTISTVIAAREHKQLERQNYNQNQIQTLHEESNVQRTAAKTSAVASSSSSASAFRSITVIGQDDYDGSDSLAKRIKNAVQPLNSYSPFKAEVRDGLNDQQK